MGVPGRGPGTPSLPSHNAKLKSMRRYLAAALLILSGALSGCIEEDWSLCEDDNCVLLYLYQDESGADLFADNIHSVDLMVFDGEGYITALYQSAQEELDRLRGVSIFLEPGDYYVVAWANLTDRTRTAVTTLTGSSLDISDGESGAPVYYAPYKNAVTRSVTRSDDEMNLYRITVPQSGIIERELYFTRAHRSINIYIKGYEDPVYGPDPRMKVEITHLAYAYDFLLRVEPLRRTHISVTEPLETPAGIISGTRVNTPYQEIEDEINIRITTAGGEAICPDINLKEYLVSIGQPLDALSVHQVDILLVYEDGALTITVPDWDEEVVDRP